jgi:hypothetical protein
MSSVPSESISPPYDAAEKGTAEIDVVLPAAVTAVDEKKGDSSAIAVTTEVVPPNSADTATATATANAKPPKREVPMWIRWTLWFNTYRFVSITSRRSVTILILLPFLFFRKLFTFVFIFNMTGLFLAASGHFPYAIKYSGAMALGNLNFAILMRNELFGRILYLFVNTCFAKVAIETFQPLS